LQKTAESWSVCISCLRSGV